MTTPWSFLLPFPTSTCKGFWLAIGVLRTSCSSQHSTRRRLGEISSTLFTPLWLDLGEHDVPAWVDQVACDLGNGAVPNHYLVGFHCGGLPFAIQRDLRLPNAKRNKGNHLNLSFEDEIPHFNRGRRCEGRSESSKIVLHLGHKGWISP